jgi:uncharacterized protein YndB with AHSA1/START domain
VTDEMTFRELDIVRVFDAPRELVWKAWTDPDQLALWWGPAGLHTPRESVEMDVRPGGVFRLTMVMDDGSAEYPSDMRYTVVEPMDRLGHAWDDQRGIGRGEATITFKDLGGTRTEVTNHYAGWSTDVVQGFMVQGTNQQFDKLAAFVEQR